jgi:hypothetical protein
MKSILLSPQIKTPVKQKIKAIAPDWIVLVREYWIAHGRLPNIIKPRTFNEKLLCRLLFDRRPVLTQITDKASMRRFVESRLSPRVLPVCYHLTTCPDDIPFDDLPERYVVKPTHGSGWVHLVLSKSTTEREALITECKSWLS